MIKRITRELRWKKYIEVYEYHDGRYGNPGGGRAPRRKPTREQIERQNRQNKTRKCRYQLLEYFDPGDLFITLTYRPEEKPQNMAAAKKDFSNLLRKVKYRYQKSGDTLRWIKNIEQGTKGGWHTHMVIRNRGDTASMITDLWKKGAVKVDKIQDEDGLIKLAAYITKEPETEVYKEDGTLAKPRLRETAYSTSRNMPLKPPKVKKFHRWKKEIKPKKGCYIKESFEGINPITGFLYRRYTMVKLE